MIAEHVQTLIIGGGQAGLNMSHMLSRCGCPHLVLERGRIGERWRSERWDGLRFQFPNWSVKLPDFPFPCEQPDGFATSHEIVAYLEAYAQRVNPPIRCGVAVTGLRAGEAGRGILAQTSAGVIAARNVVIATGPYQRPIVPRLLAGDCNLFQVHASAYKGPEQLPSGAVLIVGSGASGAQIAEELSRAGRKVYLSVGRHKRMPRRYRGRDLIWWLAEMGLDQTPVELRGPETTPTSHYRRLWRPNHRFSCVRPAGNHSVGPSALGARKSSGICRRSRSQHRLRGCCLPCLLRHGGRLRGAEEYEHAC